jgi:hypothetical protein
MEHDRRITRQGPSRMWKTDKEIAEQEQANELANRAPLRSKQEKRIVFQHRVESIILDGVTKYCIFTNFEGTDWVYRYAYDTHDKAAKIATKLDKNKYNGDAETYIRFNFWDYPSAHYFHQHFNKPIGNKSITKHGLRAPQAMWDELKAKGLVS